MTHFCTTCGAPMSTPPRPPSTICADCQRARQLRLSDPPSFQKLTITDYEEQYRKEIKISHQIHQHHLASFALIQAAIDLHDFLYTNVGATADFPVHLTTDNTTTEHDLRSRLQNLKTAIDIYRKTTRP